MNILKRKNMAPDAALAALAKFDTATIYEGLGRYGAMNSSIKPVSPDMSLCGRAITVWTQPGDNLMLLKAMDMAGHGDVIVVNGGGLTEIGYWGDMMAAQAVKNGIAGVVIDGGVRDVPEIIRMGLPLFAGGVCIKGVTKHTLGNINHPIICGGVLVNPGDVIVGDRNGVTVVPYERVDDAIRGASARAAREEEVVRRIRSGERMFEIMGFDRVLKETGCTEEE